MISACPACDVAPAALEVARADLVRSDHFSIPTVHCAACIGKVERAVAALPHVAAARVNLSLKRLSVTWRAAPAPEAVIAAVATAGYEAWPLDTDALAETGGKDRALLLRLSVAGAAMMNVMLLSVAVWSGAGDATRDLFHLISAAIALPTVAYSAQPFFVSAWSALRFRRLNMDVPISLAILLASAMSLYETLNGGAHAYFDAALSLTFFLLIGRYLDLRTRMAARSAARELTAMESHSAHKLENGRARTVRVADLAIDDLVLVPTGARVPVDGVLQDDHALVDRSFLTGESLPARVAAGAPVQAGVIVVGPAIRLLATAVGADTSLRRMADLVATAESGRNRYTALADRAARIYAPGVHLLALAAFAWWVWSSGDVRYSLNVAIAVLIITCPCALGLAVPAVSTAAIGRLFGAGFLVRHATALERLAEVDRVVFDKTGTLTLPGKGTGLETLTETEKAVALALAQASDHPIARAVTDGLAGTKPALLDEVRELPGLGLEAHWAGTLVRLGKGEWLDASFAGTGLRIGDTVRELLLEEDIRPGATDAIRVFGENGMAVEMLTGDSPNRAAIVAARLGLSEVTAAMTPGDKCARLDRLAADGHRVLMIGDGLNDTLALASAHASVAPSSALDASRNAADVVILNRDFADLPWLVRMARATRSLSVQNFAIAALYNLIAIPVALAGQATPLMAALAMSASSITVLLNAQRIRRVS